MAIVTTYVCDVSGVSGTNKADFVEVKIHSTQYSVGRAYLTNLTKEDKRLVHLDVAKKLGLLHPGCPEEKANPPAEVTFESKLKTLMQDWVGELVQQAND